MTATTAHRTTANPIAATATATATATVDTVVSYTAQYRYGTTGTNTPVVP